MDIAINMAPTTGVFALCMALGLARATFYRRRRTAAMPLHAGIPVSEHESARSLVAVRGREAEGADGPPTEPVLVADVEAARNEDNRTTVDVIAVKKTSPRGLSQGERARVLAVLNEDRFCNLAPAEIYATLLDEGQYLCCERTMYRILDDNRQVSERRNQLRHPRYVAPELMATKPRELWSWDITKLKTFVKSQYFHLYVILDVFSRFVVGWMVAERESGEFAKALIDETCERQGITPGELTFHADNGSAMVAQPVAFVSVQGGV